MLNEFNPIYLLNALVYNTEITVTVHAHQMIPPLVQNLAAFVLLVLLSYGFYNRYRRRKSS